METEPIIIQKLIVDVHVSWHDNPERLLQEVVEEVNKELLPLLEAGLQGLPVNRNNAAEKPEGPLSTPTLSINEVGLELPVFPGEAWVTKASSALVEGIVLALEQSVHPGSETMFQDGPKELNHLLEEGVGATGMEVLESIQGLEIKSEPIRLIELWVAFLSTGRLPWWKESLGILNLADLEIKSLGASCKMIWEHPALINLVETQLHAAERWVRQVAFATQKEVLEQTSALHRVTYLALLESFASFSSDLEALVKNFRAETGERAQEESIRPSSGGHKPPSRSKGVILNEVDSGVSTSDPQLTGLDKSQLLSGKGGDASDAYFSGAGLVLLHPFIPALLHRLDLTDEEGEWKDRNAHNEALHVLNHLVSGHWEASEDELVLAKLLLGWDESAIPMRLLTAPAWEAAFTTECQEILTQVQTHWPVMENCTWEGLAVDFLQRSGKLSRGENGFWKLQIENKTVDVLLRKLGWGISPIKLPWMDALLMVEWA